LRALAARFRPFHRPSSVSAHNLNLLPLPSLGYYKILHISSGYQNLLLASSKGKLHFHFPAAKKQLNKAN